MKFYLLALALWVGCSFSVFAEGGGNKFTRIEYIDLWKDEAIYQMVVHKVPASITLAQGILESADGNSELARKSNNHFGIKCHSDWKGKKTYHDDDRKGECFRHYSSANESFEDHSLFLQKPRYASLFELKIEDYKGWAKGLKKCGYATNSQYANLLIRIIEENDLERFDEIGRSYIKKGKLPDGRSYEGPLAEVPESSKKKSKSKGKDTPSEINLGSNRAQEFSANDIRYTLAKAGDSVESLAKELEMRPWQIRDYNDLGSRGELKADELIYLQPKRNSSKEAEFHTVENGESLRSISQTYGVKIKKLVKRNNLGENAVLSAGYKLKLR